MVAAHADAFVDRSGRTRVSASGRDNLVRRPATSQAFQPWLGRAGATASGREIRPPKDSDQVGVEQVAISADRRAVGWLALHPNCCTTYPIPLELVVLTSARTRTFTGDGQAIWQWAFYADSRRVSYRQGPVHGPATPHFELRDIRTGRLVSSFDGDSTEVRAAPAWVRALRAPP